MRFTISHFKIKLQYFDINEQIVLDYHIANRKFSFSPYLQALLSQKVEFELSDNTTSLIRHLSRKQLINVRTSGSNLIGKASFRNTVVSLLVFTHRGATNNRLAAPMCVTN